MPLKLNEKEAPKFDGDDCRGTVSKTFGIAEDDIFFGNDEGHIFISDMEIKSALFPMVDVRRMDKPIPSVKVVLGCKNAEAKEQDDEGNEDQERAA